MYREFVAEDTPIRDRHQLMLGAVAPRPIAFVSSVDPHGRVNLAPFSFFGAFGSNPSVIAVSPSQRGTDGSSKDTLRNVLETRELTVSVVNTAIAYQMNIASGEYPPEVDEFDKAGLTPLVSRTVKPPGVAQSPMVMECRLLQHLELGGKPSSGNLLVAQVVLFRVKEEMFDEAGRIDPAKMDQVARMGFNWYTRAVPGLFRLPQPKGKPIGFDALPEWLRQSATLTGQDLAKLASVIDRPDTEPLQAAVLERVQDPHAELKALLERDQVTEAWALVDAIEARTRTGR